MLAYGLDYTRLILESDHSVASLVRITAQGELVIGGLLVFASLFTSLTLLRDGNLLEHVLVQSFNLLLKYPLCAQLFTCYY